MNAVERVVCYGCLALALPFGALGIGLGAAGLHRLGGAALCLAGAMLILTVILALRDMSKAAKQDELEQEIIRRLAVEGSLEGKLRELGYTARVVKSKAI